MNLKKKKEKKMRYDRFRLRGRDLFYRINISSVGACDRRETDAHVVAVLKTDEKTTRNAHLRNDF